jgi:hypothetical protein
MAECGLRLILTKAEARAGVSRSDPICERLPTLPDQRRSGFHIVPGVADGAIDADPEGCCPAEGWQVTTPSSRGRPHDISASKWSTAGSDDADSRAAAPSRRRFREHRCADVAFLVGRDRRVATVDI